MTVAQEEATADPLDASIELMPDGARVNVAIASSGLAEYLRAIPAEKRLIAMTHVIEVGLTEVARRHRRPK